MARQSSAQSRAALYIHDLNGSLVLCCQRCCAGRLLHAQLLRGSVAAVQLCGCKAGCLQVVCEEPGSVCGRDPCIGGFQNMVRMGWGSGALQGRMLARLFEHAEEQNNKHPLVPSR
jgi:hypothetical protein